MRPGARPISRQGIRPMGNLLPQGHPLQGFMQGLNPGMQSVMANRLQQPPPPGQGGGGNFGGGMTAEGQMLGRPGGPGTMGGGMQAGPRDSSMTWNGGGMAGGNMAGQPGVGGSLGSMTPRMMGTPPSANAGMSLGGQFGGGMTAEGRPLGGGQGSYLSSGPNAPVFGQGPNFNPSGGGGGGLSGWGPGGGVTNMGQLGGQMSALSQNGGRPPGYTGMGGSGIQNRGSVNPYQFGGGAPGTGTYTGMQYNPGRQTQQGAMNMHPPIRKGGQDTFGYGGGGMQSNPSGYSGQMPQGGSWSNWRPGQPV